MTPRRLQTWLADLTTWGLWHLVYKNRPVGPRIPVLCYHRVLPHPLGSDPLPGNVYPEEFAAQMAFLAERGFVSLSLEEFGEIARGGRPPGKNAVLITFDDGYADCFAVAWPIAQRYGMKINLFVCTAYVGHPEPLLIGPDGYREAGAQGLPEADNAALQGHLHRFPHLWRPLTWEEVRHLQEAGVQVGLHGHAHRNYARLNPEEVAQDLDRGLALFEGALGCRPQFFALPYGWFSDYNEEVLRILARANFKLIFASHFGRARLPDVGPVLPRLVVQPRDSLAAFQRKIFGACDWLESRRQRKWRAGGAGV